MVSILQSRHKQKPGQLSAGMGGINRKWNRHAERPDNQVRIATWLLGPIGGIGDVACLFAAVDIDIVGGCPSLAYGLRQLARDKLVTPRAADR